MAQIVNYFADDVEIIDGPFVVCQLPYGCGYRIEVELKGHHTTVLADYTIYQYLTDCGYPFRSLKKETMEKVVDFLNYHVKTKDIVNRRGTWVLPVLTKN